MTGESPPPRIPGLEVGEKIGEGGSSVVYRATHLTLRRGVAVKVFRGTGDATADGPAGARESQLTAALAHPHVVAVHDAGQADGRPYLVLEEMPGGSLRRRMLPNSPWPLDRAAAVLDQVAGAVEHVHARGVLHLDLKPENVLFAADGTVKVTDFGLAVPHADERAWGGRRSLGTLDYSAPEQWAGLPVDARADVFALATLAYELLTGRLPGRVYVPAAGRNPRLPAALDDVLRRGLARDPADRFPTAAAFRRALAGVVEPPRPRVSVGWLAAVVGVTAATVALVVALTRNGRPPVEPSAASAVSDRPTALWVLSDRAGDPDLFEGVGETEVEVRRITNGNPPHELPLPFPPKPRPVLVVRSPGAWGFVHPLADRTLARRVVADWPTLLRATPAKNFVTAGGFDGECLAATRDEQRAWRVGDGADGVLGLDRPPDQPGNPALRLDYPGGSRKQVGAYQMLATGPGPGCVAVLRYRVRTEQGRPSVAVYGSTHVALNRDTGVAAERVRRIAEVADGDDRRLYRVPGWVTPTDEWQTVVVVTEFPPPPAGVVPHQVVIDTTPGRVWVDDVAWFAWSPEGRP